MIPNLRLASLTINLYEVMTAVAYAAAAVYLFYTASRIPGIKKRDLLIVLLLCFPIQWIGGNILPMLYKSTVLHEKLAWKDLLSAGRYFHSVFLICLIYALIVFRLLHWPVRKCLDLVAIAAMLMSAIGRLGCFCQGCCSGKPTNLPWGLFFPSNPTVRVHPTQLYMFFAELALMAALLLKNRVKQYDGEVFWNGVLWYSLYRFLIEFFRTNPAFMNNLTHAQAFSLLTGLTAYLVMAEQNMKIKKRKLSDAS